MEAMEDARLKYLQQLEQSQIEHQEVMRQVKAEQERVKKQLKDQEQKYHQQVADTQNQKILQEKMKGIRKDITEANEIAKLMNKKIQLEDIYVCKINDQEAQNDFNNVEMKDEVQVKVQNFESNAVYIWSQERFQEKLLEMRDAL